MKLDEVAAAILDGAEVDWVAAESGNPGSDRELIPYLRVVARIAEAHRVEATADPAAPPAPSPPTLRASSAVAEPPFETWGHLEVRERIGAGAFGDVYRAWDSRLDREVALKLLAREGSSSQGSTVIAEGSLLARVRHPNVVAVHGAERAGGRVGIWMEFIAGRGLDQVLHAQGPMSAHEAALIGLSVCRALSAVHRARLLHRDIKAQNVMREDGGRIVLMDFGTGRALVREGDDPAGDLAGTPLYLAPEVFAGRDASVQSDIYSLGVLLFHLVTGSYPVAAATVRELKEAHMAGRRRFLRDERPDLPDDFVAVVERAIAPDPTRRFPTAGAMEDALAGVVAARVPAPPRTSVRWRGATAALVLSVAAAAVALLPRISGDRPPRFAGSPPPRARGGAPGSSSVQVRKLSMPEMFLLGRPAADGRLFSFSDEEGNLAVLDLASGDVRRLTTGASLEGGTEQYAEFSAVSADSHSVAYTWWALDGTYELRVIDVDAKRPRLLLRSEKIDMAVPVDWLRDGQSILCVLTRVDGTHQLAFISVRDGTVHPVMELGAVRPRHVSLSPDAAFIVYDAPQERNARAADVFVVRTDGTDPHPLLRHPANDIEAVWTPDGTRILFASDRSGTMDLWAVDVSDGAARGEPQVAHRGIGRMSLLGLTDRGAYYYHLLVGAVEVYAADLTVDGRVGTPKPLGPSYSGSNISSIWSPDGREVAYASRRGLASVERRATTLAIRDLQTGEQRDLAPALDSFLVQSWSPDGRQILVKGSDRRRAGIYALDVDTGGKTPIVLADRLSSATDIRRGQWMPDGERVVYANEGRHALLFRSLRNGADDVALDFREEGIDGLTAGVLGRGYGFSADGRTLAFSAGLREGAAWTNALRVKAGGKPSRELVKAREPEGLVFQDWMPDGSALLFTKRTQGQPPSLWRISTEGGEAEPLGFAMPALRDVSVHPDGRRITFTAGSPTMETWVMENFLEELPRP